MPRKKRVVRKYQGEGFWDTIKSIAGPVNDILKSTHAISTIAPLVPGVGQTVGRVAGALGYGKKKKGGRSIISDEKILMIPKKGRGSHMSMSGSGLLL